MIFYGRPPLMRSVREYQPTLSPTAYKIDLLANEKEINKDSLKTMMAEYLSTPSKNKQEKKYQSKIRRALRKLDKTDNVRGIVNTDKVGWKQIKNDYIY